ncbi:hypothetical protein QBC34DRAFT_420954 [Podospora aff. communis PSN243]|uniref:Uncharacterized protein n=1 Tax=Podospora aff. communis PSN243 TaxID=3040156 RepID=A0AAV9H6D6_9PEZI|nr:hypothetical protein QBC34DRAFT_420954 [Podospora aff. communis PSN243]
MAEMEIETDDDILKKVAVDGSMDYASWPSLLRTIVSRIEKISHSEFSIPHIPPPRPPPRPASPRFLTQLPSSDLAEGADSSDTATSSQENNKENASPTPSLAFSQAATNAASSSSSTIIHSSSPPPTSSNAALSSTQDPPQPQQQQQQQPPPQPELPSGTLPTPVAALLSEVTSTLTLNFTTYPPHTIQRLAELVLRPRQHYRSVVSYLHALDRVVHVTSGANIYPLPPAVPDIGAMTVLANGIAGAGLGTPSAVSTTTSSSIGSDEALGGALLTPIPWLARRANGGSGGARGGAGSSDDGSSDAGTASPLSSGSSSGGGSVSASSSSHQQQQQQQQQQRQSTTPTPGSQAASSLGSGSARKSEPQLRTESTETIEGPNGMGSIETVSISVNGIHSMGAAGGPLAQRGVTQGELLRQEQRAGVVPVSQLARHAQTATQQHQHAQQQASTAGGASSLGATSPDEDASMAEDVAASENADDEEEIPHARGPEEIGAADTGPQRATSSPFTVSGDGTVEMHGIDVEAAVGRRLNSPDTLAQSSSSPEAVVPKSPKREATEELDAGAAKKVKEEGSQMPESTPESKPDTEGDVVLSDSTKLPSSPSTVKADTSPENRSPTESGPGPGDADGSNPKPETGVKAENSPGE